MQSILQWLQSDEPPPDIVGLHGASIALLLGRAVEALQRTICCIAPSDDQLEILAQDLAFFSSARVLIYPSYEIPPYTPLSPDPATVCTRLATLYQLKESRDPLLILTSAEAVLRRVMPASVLNDRCELVITGEDLDRDALIASLVASGYQLCDLVRQEGDVAVRGGIIDIYPPILDSETGGPLRIDFFGDTVESIRLFDPLTQRSRQELAEAILLPASDLLFPRPASQTAMMEAFDQAAEGGDWTTEEIHVLRERFATGQRYPGMEFMLPLLYGGRGKLQTLFDYLPPSASLVLCDPPAVRQRLHLVRDRIQANYTEALAHRKAVVPPGDLFAEEEEFTAICRRSLLARLAPLPDPERAAPPLSLATGDHSLLAQEIELQRKKRGLLAPLTDRIHRWQEDGDITVLACRSSRQADHLREMLANYHLSARQAEAPLDLTACTDPLVVYMVQHPLSKGFDLLDRKTHILSATELFGEKRLGRGRQARKRRQEGQPVQIDQLAVGDLVVHRDHGIGIFQGLVNMEFSGLHGDFMLILYRDDNKLYVPVDRLHWVSRYQGLTDEAPKLDSLGSQRWQTTKKK
jgi:transcription-repair coupling factor (superfamily II helicase)